jgi:outer membrane lipoprotein carrier protein
MLKKTVLLLGLFSAQSVFADAAADLNVLLNKIESFKADFTQKQIGEDGELMQTTEGSAAIARPQKMRWELQEPFPSLIVVNDHVLWRYDPELEQASRETLSDSLQQTPALLLSGNSEEILKQYSVTQSTSGFRLEPLDKVGVFRALVMQFEGEQLNGMDIVDDFGQRTEIRFREMTVNETLDETLFNFAPPEGTDVLFND